MQKLIRTNQTVSPFLLLPKVTILADQKSKLGCEVVGETGSVGSRNCRWSRRNFDFLREELRVIRKNFGAEFGLQDFICQTSVG